MTPMCSLSGLLWHGAPHAVMERVRGGTLALVSSPALLAELADVIGRANFDAVLARSNRSRERLLAEVQQLAEIVAPPPLPAPVCRDPDDDEVLALAIAAQIDLVVSGDHDLLSLGSIDILSPRDAGERIGVPR